MPAAAQLCSHVYFLALRFDARATLGISVLNREDHRNKTHRYREIELSAARCEESQLALKSLVATAEATIRETRALIADLGKILAKRL